MQPLFAVVVHAFNEIAEALVHQLAFDFSRRRDGFAFLFRIERFRQNAEALDLLHAREHIVRFRDFFLDQPDDARIGREAREAGIGDIDLCAPNPRPCRNRFQ